MDAIRQFRTKRGLSQKEMAAMLGVSPALISEIERGNRKVSPRKVREWAGKLKVSRAALRPDIFGPEAA
jgi:transcriptional regulator with XRE-family HTH domain